MSNRIKTTATLKTEIQATIGDPCDEVREREVIQHTASILAADLLRALPVWSGRRFEIEIRISPIEGQ